MQTELNTAKDEKLVDLDTSGEGAEVELEDKSHGAVAPEKYEEVKTDEKDKSKGGIILTDKTIEDSQLTASVAMVLAVGDDAYQDKEKFPNGPWCKQGDWVVFGRYAGSRIRIDGGEVRLLNDDEILGTVDNPEDILTIL